MHLPLTPPALSRVWYTRSTHSCGRRGVGGLLLLLLLSACAGTASVPTPASTAAPLPTLTVSPPAPSPSPTSSSTLSPTTTLVASTSQSPLACSPLVGFDRARLLAAVSNPFRPPAPGSDQPHAGIDLADTPPGSQVAQAGRGVESLFPGRVAAVVRDRFPFGNALIVETPLQGLRFRPTWPCPPRRPPPPRSNPSPAPPRRVAGTSPPRARSTSSTPTCRPRPASSWGMS
jgi:hypothetical protein